MTRKIAATAALVLSLVTMLGALSACNTMAGAGQDMQQGGRALEDSADRHGATPGAQ